MVRRIVHHRHFVLVLCIVACVAIAGAIAATSVLLRTTHEVALASTNISPAGNAHWAWNDAIGWIDFYTPGTVEVNGYGMTGYASSSIGPISFSGPGVSGQSQSTDTITFGLTAYNGSYVSLGNTSVSVNVSANSSTQTVASPEIDVTGLQYIAPSFTNTGGGTFTTDFRLGVQVCEYPGSNCGMGWTDWASYYAGQTFNAGNVQALVVSANPSHNRFNYVTLYIQTRPIPEGTNFHFQAEMGAELWEWDYLIPNNSYDEGAVIPENFNSSCGASFTPVGGGTGPIMGATNNVGNCGTSPSQSPDVIALTIKAYNMTGATQASNISSSTYAVVNDGSGNLSGWAWNDAVGWISFCGGQSTSTCPGTTPYQVTIDSNGNFHGWAWNDAIGWIDFNCANNNTCGTSNYYVSTGWVATGTIGVLESIPYDTQDVKGAQLDSVEWQGTQPSGTSVEFQFAVSNSSSGPWNFTGPDGTPNTYYVPSGPGVALPLNYNLYSNYRYFRYLVTLVATPINTPVVDNVIVDWSP